MSFARLLRRKPSRPDPNAAITRLFRNPPQLRALARLLAGRERLRILVHAMADGAEAVSLLVALDPAAWPVDLEIHGRELSAGYVEDAKTFAYSKLHMPRRPPLPFGAYLSRRLLGGWAVRSRWRSVFRYAEGDVLKPEPGLPRHGFDLVACQNLLVNLPEEARGPAFANLVHCLASGGVLAVGGGPLGEIHRLAREHGLTPVLDDVEAIHEAWEVQRAFWSNPRRPYWALEPFDPGQPDGPERYVTLFHKEAG
ncbi:MAG: CheR family methyltransferase [Acidobacteriota bacterium]